MNREFYYWCRDAVSEIRYWKDQNKVYAELYGHLEDRYEALLAQGLSPEEAEKQALAAMGSAEELAPQLAQIHKPHWTYAAIATRFIAIIMLIFCIGYGISYGIYHGFFEFHENTVVWVPFTQGGDERISYVKPNVTDSSDGFLFRVKEAALWRTYFSQPSEDGRTYFDSLYLGMTVTNPIPWIGQCEGIYWMWAVDSKGTYYYSNHEANDADVPWIGIFAKDHGMFSYDYELHFQDTANDIEWIELHYDRDGRDVVLRVDLPGGEAA